MNKVTLRTYAQMNKMSYFQVMKKVRNQEIKTIMLEEDGKEVEYIDLDAEQNKAVEETPSLKVSLEEENATLKQEILRLRAELEKCNKRTVLAKL